ncbi:MAG TPA: glycosyl hydrolase family protein [Saprospiraceae bacterium]|nr:glycosyl hydrolase family protein [Saprospiraceae bacterium]
MLKNKIYIFFLLPLIFALQNCSPKIVKHDILHFDNNIDYKLKYYANGHLSKEKYPVKILQKDGRQAVEIIKASDASIWSGMSIPLQKPIAMADGKLFSVEVWMDHLGTVVLRLSDSKDGGANSTVSTPNSKINQWETLYFDFGKVINENRTYEKFGISIDLHHKGTGKDVVSYFSNIQQLQVREHQSLRGNKADALTIVILGSSTAAGMGPNDSKNTWVNRFRQKLQSINGYHKVINLAVSGYTTYQLLPTGTKVPTKRPRPDPQHNVSKALSYHPDAILINLPSNDAANGFSVKEQLDNYRKICKPIYQQNIPVWVATPQGRNMAKEKRQIQRIIRDSTYEMFERKTLDFWRNLATWSGEINPKYNCGDGIHLNDEGHRLLFEEVWSKDIPKLLLEKRKNIVGKDADYSSPLQYEGYQLVWQDEFDGTQLDTSIWTHELGDGCPQLCGWGNKEKVWYRKDNTTVTNGKLIITAKADVEKAGFWSSSRIITMNKKHFQFGRIDIRAKLTKSKGLWPALWLLGENRVKDSWPYCGEIDIMESVGHIPYRVRGSVFYKAKKGWTASKGAKYELKYDNFSDAFHVYSIEWNEQGIKYFVDNQQYNYIKYNELSIDTTDNPFLKPFYLIINLAVGGNFPGNPDKTSVFPQSLEVDYVRYFRGL